MTATSKNKFSRSKVTVTYTPNGNANITDSNKSSRCTASCLKLAGDRWNVRIDRFGIDGWKYAANVQAATAEAAYEYCLIFGERVED